MKDLKQEVSTPARLVCENCRNNNEEEVHLKTDYSLLPYCDNKEACIRRRRSLDKAAIKRNTKEVTG